MNRYETLQNIFFETITQHCHGDYQQRAFFHSISVSTLCQKIALQQHLDIEIAGIIGLFHDYAQFIHHSSFQHALRSSEMIIPFLDAFSFNEKTIIQTAIRHHSNKEHIHDSYSELLKDADLLAQYFAEPDIVFAPQHFKRIQKYL